MYKVPVYELKAALNDVLIASPDLMNFVLSDTKTRLNLSFLSSAISLM